MLIHKTCYISLISGELNSIYQYNNVYNNKLRQPSTIELIMRCYLPNSNVFMNHIIKSHICPFLWSNVHTVRGFSVDVDPDDDSSPYQCSKFRNICISDPGRDVIQS